MTLRVIVCQQVHVRNKSDLILYLLWLMVNKTAIRILHHQYVQEDPSQFNTVFKVEIRCRPLHNALEFSLEMTLIHAGIPMTYRF